LQAVGGDVRDSLRQATSAALQKGKQASKHGKPTAGRAHEYDRRSGHMEEVGRSAEHPQPSSGLFGVLSQTGVLLQYFQGSSMNLLGSDIGRAEDFVEMAVGHSSEVCAVFRLHTQHHGVGVQRFAFTLGHVLGQLVHHAAQRQQRLAAVGQGAVGGAAVGTGGHAEGGVAGGTVDDGGQNVSRQAALTLEQHVAPAAVRATRRFSECVQRGGGNQSTEQNPFHGYFSSSRASISVGSSDTAYSFWQ